MRKIFSLLAAVLFAGSMMADPIVINASDVTTIASGATSGLDVTLQGINIVWQGAYYNSDGGDGGSASVDFRVYANKSMTLTAESNISKVEIAGYVKANFTLSVNNGTVTTGDSYASETTKSTLEDPLIVVENINATSVALTCTKQMRAYIIRVTLAEGGVTPPAVATPVISGEAEFTDSVIVTMTCSTQDADIYYTTDGTTDPKCDCAAAPEYKKPIVLKETTTIMAAAYTGNDWSAVATKTFTKVVPPANLGEKTIAEFLTLKNVKDTCVLTGVVDSIKNTTYGNLYLSDATGQVYVYGVLNAAGEAKKFAELGIDVNDTLTIKAIYSEYNNAPQVKNAIFVSVKKAQSVVPPTPQADSILFEGEHAVTWDTPLNLEAAKFANAKAGQKIVVTYKDATDAIEFKVLDVWCHIAGSREAASLDQAEGSHTYEQFLTANAVDSIKAHGLQIIGNHFTITKVELLDGKELKEGATIWTGFFWADDWKTLEICHESFNYVDFSKYDVLRIYSEANRSDFVINIKENWEEGGQIASQADMVAGEGYMELPLTDALRTRLANAHHLMFQFNKEAGEPFNVTDIVLANYPAAPTQYEVAEAIAAGLKENDEVLVRGIITKMEFKGKNFAKYGSVNIYVADATGAEGEFEFFNCYSLEADTFRTSTPAYDPESTTWAQFSEVVDGNGVAIHVGDTVIARGLYKLYNSTHELNTGCYLTDIKHAPVVPADTITLVFDTANTTYPFVDNQYFVEYGSTDLYLSDIKINTATYDFEGDGHYLVFDFYPENPNDITGTYTATDESLDLEYTYLLTINGTDTAEVMFADGEVEIAVGRVNKEVKIAEIAVTATLNSLEGDVYKITANVIAYYDFLPEEGVENVVVDPKAIKRIKYGQVIIEKNGVEYNVLGTRL